MKMWEFIEKDRDRDYRDERYKNRGRDYDDYNRMGMKYSDSDFKRIVEDAYECGVKEGYKRAMEEVDYSSYGERRMGR